MKPPAWLPNGLDESAYPTRLKLAQWRWQFLRRRVDYRQAWADIFSVAPKPSDPGFKTWEATYSDYPRGVFGMLFVLDPSVPIAPFGLFVREPPFPVDYASGETFDRWADAGIQAVTFDLNKRLAPQLRLVGKSLERAQKEWLGGAPPDRQRPDKWRLYLRVLDAVEHGIPYSKIAAALRPKIARADIHMDRSAMVSDWLLQAKRTSEALTSTWN